MKKYSLDPESWDKYKEVLKQKVQRMHATQTFSVQDPNQPNVFDLLYEHTQVKEHWLKAERTRRWPDQDPAFANQEEMDVFTDEQIKASTVGSWIHQSLTETAREQIKAYKDFFEVVDSEMNPHYDGPSYLWKLSEVIDPDNTHMVENVKKELASLNVKDFGQSAILRWWHIGIIFVHEPLNLEQLMMSISSIWISGRALRRWKKRSLPNMSNASTMRIVN